MAEQVAAEARQRYERAVEAARQHVDALSVLCGIVAEAQQAVTEVATAQAALDRAGTAPARGEARRWCSVRWSLRTRQRVC